MAVKSPPLDNLGILDAGLVVLEGFCANGRPQTLGEISARLQLSKSRVYRILTVLKRRQFVEQAIRGGPYRPGPKLELLGTIVGQLNSLPHIAHPIMVELSLGLRGTIVLRTLDDKEQLTIACVHSPEVLRTSFPVGVRVPASYGSTRKALLASCPPEMREAILRRAPPDKLDAFRAELDATRARGYALNLEETVRGVRSVAASIVDRNNIPIGALGMSFPTFALPRSRIPAIGKALAEACEALSIQLGSPSYRRIETKKPGRNK